MSQDLVAYGKALDARTAALFKAAPGPMRAFHQLVAEATKDGVLDAKIKELMALAISVSLRCEGCIVYHTRAAFEKGASREEVVETIAVAVEMGGGPAAVYGGQALAAYDQHAR
ncbi:MAG TPA: carboxymuconolactone decarboxylase family protein [Rhodospirillales bacterium]|jgi:AhpD family alkylhydroperoxidase|nr:carboxymuconolactone decarboxylase family protein [Rhodospirillales bacterium]HJO69543.1 carboxymuconolactone decarboxylase family protein [Rhodospirillales bacterium]